MTLSEGPSSARHKSLRLPGYDYGQEGAYFLTICTANHASLLGKIVDDAACLSRIGKLVEEEWLRSSEVRPTIELDAHIVMPNHLHGIVVIATDDRSDHGAHGFHSPSRTIGAVVRGFKAASTSRIKKEALLETGSIWQRNYCEHVIRNDDALQRIREYIVNNPARWDEDRFFAE